MAAALPADVLGRFARTIATDGDAERLSAHP